MWSLMRVLVLVIVKADVVGMAADAVVVAAVVVVVECA